MEKWDIHLEGRGTVIRRAVYRSIAATSLMACGSSQFGVLSLVFNLLGHLAPVIEASGYVIWHSISQIGVTGPRSDAGSEL